MDMLLNNYLLLGVVAIAAIPLILSTLGGLVKGAKRAILRLIIVVASFIGAFILKDQFVETVLAMEINGQTIVELINSKLPEQFASLSEQIIPLLTAVVTVLVFFVLYNGAMIASWIVYLILCIFIKKGIGKKKRKFRLIGLVVGAAQGVFAAITLTMPLVGLICDLAPIQDVDLSALNATQSTNTIEYCAEEGGDTTTQEGSSESFDLAGTLAQYKIDLKAFADNEYIKKDMEIIAKLEGFGYGYTQLSTATKTITNDDGTTTEKKITIGGQIEAIKAAVDLAGKLSELTNLDFSEGFDVTNAEDIKNVFSSLGSLFGDDMSEEAKETVNELINSVAADLLGDAAEDLPIDLSTIDFTGIDFETEGELIVNLMNYADPENTEEIEVGEIVTQLASSELILPILDSTDVTVDLDETQKEEAQAAIANLPADTDPETIAKLNALLGLTTEPAPEE